MSINNPSNGPDSTHDLWTTVSIINNVPDLLYFINPEGRLVLCNKNFRELLKLERDFTDLPYEKMAKAFKLNKDQIGEIQKDDLALLFMKPIQEQDLLIEGTQRLLKFHRQVIFAQEKRVPIGLLVVIKEEEHVAKQTSKTSKKTTKTVDAPRVLLVEDNPLASAAASMIFKGCGCTVDVAEKETETLALFDANEYDLIIMDLGLPDCPGYIVAKKIRQREQAKSVKDNVPIIGLTAFIAKNVINDCAQNKMNGLLTKPLTDEQAHQLIERFVQDKETEVEGITYI